MKFECTVCGHVYDEEVEGTPWAELRTTGSARCAPPTAASSRDGRGGRPRRLPDGWRRGRSFRPGSDLESYLAQWRKASDEAEPDLAAIQHAAVTGESIIEPMRTRKPVISGTRS